ncbi:Uncharacterised protein [Mycobacteroides abscessus subsp. bolletii]|nr:Uncharacterised protein [Mycobacteroides abscessus]SKF61038.1 Uncharacterised protein [Mycobacteroides abscessus subsp. bolletii]SKH65395.1 Uncharacterised protein [Mycobacteroides abscessus subsp. bolletii]
MAGFMHGVPDIGITKKTPLGTNIGEWTVDLTIYSMTAEQARQVAAELLNSADMADDLNQKIRDSLPRQ